MQNYKNKFEELDAWIEAHRLVIDIYTITKEFPREEQFRLVDQLCRSASSVPANIVEGNSRGSKKDFIRFLIQARASLEELKYHLLLACDLGYIDRKEYEKILDQCNRVGMLTNGLIRYLKSKI